MLIRRPRGGPCSGQGAVDEGGPAIGQGGDTVAHDTNIADFECEPVTGCRAGWLSSGASGHRLFAGVCQQAVQDAGQCLVEGSDRI